MLMLLLLASSALEWPQFRGPNSSGLSPDTNLPSDFGPEKNVIWKTALPPGHSSPVLTRDRIFLTAVDGPKLVTISLDRATGKILWRREAPRPRVQKMHEANSAAAPSAATDGSNVYVFFGDFGLLSYGPDGNERWRIPLGPFNNPMGFGASPVLAGGLLLMICDSETDSFFLAVDKDSGAVRWRVERPEVTRGFSTPVLYQPERGGLQALVTGAYRLTAYDLKKGEPVWWLGGLTWQIKTTPVIDREHVYIQGWAGGADTGQQEEIIPYDSALKVWDSNRDGRLAKDEVLDQKIVKAWNDNDLDTDGHMGARDWNLYRSKRSVQNGLNAFRLGGRGDMTEKSRLWRYTKSLPNVPSPLLYQGVLYMLKEGGILTTLDPASGNVIKQARLEGALGQYFASPVAADGKVFTLSEEGKLTVLKAAGDWEILSVNDLADGSHSTPAIAAGRIYVRTHSALHCFGKSR
ncbi:MAG: pyrrolo-quinoline quinone [Acidobacteria bacterium]|nr:pyrrolo-quinoline quinone [Acidobacteriota bacterium]